MKLCRRADVFALGLKSNVYSKRIARHLVYLPVASLFSFNKQHYAVIEGQHPRYTIPKINKSCQKFQFSTQATIPQRPPDIDFPLVYSAKVDHNKYLQTLNLKMESSSSVSKILNETMSEQSRAALDNWKKMKIKELGEEGFAIYQASLFEKGKGLHISIANFLGGVTTLTDTVVPAENEGHWKSLEHVLVKITKPLALEKPVAHPYLKYHGIVDCICKYKGRFLVVDWKTSDKKKLNIDQLYDNPVQVSAYIGASNFDTSIEKKTLQKGAVVVAYSCGTPADVFVFEPEKYWALWLQRLLLFRSKA